MLIIGFTPQRYIIINKVTKYLQLNIVNAYANDRNL